jgi:hypothetical protein
MLFRGEQPLQMEGIRLDCYLAVQPHRTTPTHIGKTLQKSQYSVIKVQNQPFYF